MPTRIDSTHIPNLKIIQDKSKFCYGIDAVLLADFVIKNSQIRNLFWNGDTQNQDFSQFAQKTDFELFDLGTGNAIIPLLLQSQKSTAHKNFSLKLHGIELQSEMCLMAQDSVKLNNFESDIFIHNCDILNIQNEFSCGKADIVVSNPPYMIAKNGRQSQNLAKMIARQELRCTLNDVVKSANHLLNENGEFFMIHRTERLQEILQTLKNNNFTNVEYKLILPFENQDATMVLVKSQKCSCKNFEFNSTKMQDLIIYKENGIYTDTVNKIYGRE